jgi:AcrR family transcriptional regulator
MADHHGNRYGRSEQARQAVLEAADDLLAERGFAGVTMEGIAARAGVSKQTIYRWWSSKVDVLLDAFVEDMEEDLVPPDCGDLRRDLRAYVWKVAQFLGASDPGAVFRALVGLAQHDADFAVRLRRDYLSQQRQRDRVPFDRAVERGEVSGDVDFMVDQVMGPVYYRVLVSGEPVTREFVDAVVDRFLGRA